MKLTTDTLRILNTSLNGAFKNAFENAPSDFEKIASVITSTKSSNTYDWLGETTEMREWIGDRVIQNLKEYDYTLKNKSYENTIGVKRTDLEDDETGKYTPIIQDMAFSAKTLPDTLIFGELLKNGTSNLCYDKQYFFDTDHPVGDKSVSNFFDGSAEAWYLMNTTRPIRPFIWQKRQEANFVAMDKPDDESVFMRDRILYGVDCRGNAGYGPWQMCFCCKQELTADSLSAVFAAMSSLKSENGKPLNNRPNLLVVSPALRMKATELLLSDKIGGTSNPNKNLVSLLDTAWLA